MSYSSLGYASAYPLMGMPAPVFQNATMLQQGLHGYGYPYQSFASPAVSSLRRPDVQNIAQAPLVKVVQERPAATAHAIAAPVSQNTSPALTTLAEKKSVDLFRETPLRYGGYLNEMGESFAGILSPKQVLMSHQLTAVYCLADVLEKAYKGYVHGKDGQPSASRAAAEALDAGVFQWAASYYIPAKIINVAKAAMDKSLAKTALTSFAKKWIPTSLCLASIPFLIAPIDAATNSVMDATLRPLIGTKTHHQKNEEKQTLLEVASAKRLNALT